MTATDFLDEAPKSASSFLDEPVEEKESPISPQTISAAQPKTLGQIQSESAGEALRTSQTYPPPVPTAQEIFQQQDPIGAAISEAAERNRQKAIGQFGQYAPGKARMGFREFAETPYVRTEKNVIKKDDPILQAAGKEVYNFLVSVPEFFTSPLGASSLVAGKLIPGSTPMLRAGFTEEVARNMLEQAPALYENWDKLSPSERTAGVVNFIGSGAMLYGLSKETKPTTGVQDASKISQAAEVHGDVRPLEAPAEVVPVEEGGPRVQPQAQTPVSEVLLTPKEAKADFFSAMKDLEAKVGEREAGQFMENIGNVIPEGSGWKGMADAVRKRIAEVEAKPTVTETTPTVPAAEIPEAKPAGRDWEGFYEELTGELDAFAPARITGKINYELEDAAARFVDYAKTDKSGKPLDKLVSDFAKTDKASASQISKIRKSVKSVLAAEAAAEQKRYLKLRQEATGTKPEVKPVVEAGVKGELQMAFVPGAKEFFEQDVVPAATTAAQTLKETAAQTKALLAPAAVSPESRLGAGIIRERRAELAQKDLQAREQFAKAKRQMDGLSPQASLAFIDRVERGAPQPNAEMTRLATELRQAFDKRVAQVRAVNPKALQHLIQDYFPHIWKDPTAATSWYARILGRRPLRGPASFLKQRTIPTTADGVAAGLTPVSWNPIELSLLKFHEMDRYVMGQQIFKEFKDKGLAQFSRSDIPPDGFAKIDDRIANVVEYRPTTKVSGAPGAKERILRGHWFVQQDAARVLNNFLSPGLERYKWFRALRWFGNTLNMAQLGLSGYHFTFTMIDSGTSKLSLGIEQATQGKLKGAATMARGVAGTVLANQLEYYVKGSKVLREYTKPGSVGGDYAKIVDALLAAGGRTEMPKIFKNSSLENFFTAARTGNYPGAVLRAPFAAIEAVSYPLMQNIVPRLKLGAFSDMALHEIERLGPNVSRDQFRAEMGKIWDSIDNRMGELVYDNLFWNRTLKDLSFVAVRAVGWNLGTLRELGGGMVDTAKLVGRIQRGDPIVTKRMAYLVALPITVGFMGALYQKLRTGQNPDNLRDYYYPKTGNTLPDGTPERVNFPSYLKDIGSYSRHPLTTVGHKLHPTWSMVIDMLNNKDFYGTQIRNPDDPLVKQVGQEAAFIARTYLPFSVRGAQRRVGAKESTETKAESFFGVMPISPEIARTAAQNKIMEYAVRRMPQGARTPEEQARHEFNKDMDLLVQSPADYAAAQRKLLEAQRRGELSRGQRLYQQNKLQFERLQMEQGKTKSQAQWLWRFRHLTADEMQHVYDMATPQEKALFDRTLKLKLQNAR